MGWKQELGSKIQSQRLAAGMSLRGLGKAVQMTAETLRQYELGARVPDADKLVRIAVALGIEEFLVENIKVLVAQTRVTTATHSLPEQLKFDFERRYANSRATVKIGRDSISVTFTGLRIANGPSGQ